MFRADDNDDNDDNADDNGNATQVPRTAATTDDSGVVPNDVRLHVKSSAIPSTSFT